MWPITFSTSKNEPVTSHHHPAGYEYSFIAAMHLLSRRPPLALNVFGNLNSPQNQSETRIYGPITKDVRKYTVSCRATRSSKILLLLYKSRIRPEMEYCLLLPDLHFSESIEFKSVHMSLWLTNHLYSSSLTETLQVFLFYRYFDRKMIRGNT